MRDFLRFAWLLLRESIASPRTTSVLIRDRDGKWTATRYGGQPSDAEAGR